MAPEEQSFLPGDVVKTSFGVGVIVRGITTTSPFYKVLLWRIPGKSIGSSSTAYLQPSAVSFLVSLALVWSCLLLSQLIWAHTFLASIIPSFFTCLE
jgi:hypothetical protein